jgi:hypothetical protein
MARLPQSPPIYPPPMLTCQHIPAHHQVDGHDTKAEAKQSCLQQTLTSRAKHTANQGRVATLTSLS